MESSSVAAESTSTPEEKETLEQRNPEIQIDEKVALASSSMEPQNAELQVRCLAVKSKAGGASPQLSRASPAKGSPAKVSPGKGSPSKWARKERSSTQIKSFTIGKHAFALTNHTNHTSNISKLPSCPILVVMLRFIPSTYDWMHALGPLYSGVCKIPAGFESLEITKVSIKTVIIATSFRCHEANAGD